MGHISSEVKKTQVILPVGYYVFFFWSVHLPLEEINMYCFYMK